MGLTAGQIATYKIESVTAVKSPKTHNVQYNLKTSE